MTTAISIQNVSKAYRLGVIGHGTLREDLQSWWARGWDKEDTNRLGLTWRHKCGVPA